MTAAGKIDMATSKPAAAGDLLLGEDWESPDASLDPSISEGRARRGLISLNRSPLARKIIVFNLLALIVLVSGVLFLNPFRDSLVVQREKALVTEAQLVANVIGATQAALGALPRNLDGIAVGAGLQVFLFDPSGALVAQGFGQVRPGVAEEKPRSTVITDFLNTIWSGVSGVVGGRQTGSVPADGSSLARGLFAKAALGETASATGRGNEGGTIFSVATPVLQSGSILGVIALASAEGEIDSLVRYEREQILQMFVIALLVSIGLSLVLASTIANPLSDLAAAAELGRDRDARKLSPGRIRIPDLAARPDEIGRLSVAMRRRCQP